MPHGSLCCPPSHSQLIIVIVPPSKLRFHSDQLRLWHLPLSLSLMPTLPPTPGLETGARLQIHAGLHARPVHGQVSETGRGLGQSRGRCKDWGQGGAQGSVNIDERVVLLVGFMTQLA